MYLGLAYMVKQLHMSIRMRKEGEVRRYNIVWLRCQAVWLERHRSLYFHFSQRRARRRGWTLHSLTRCGQERLGINIALCLVWSGLATCAAAFEWYCHNRVFCNVKAWIKWNNLSTECCVIVFTNGNYKTCSRQILLILWITTITRSEANMIQMSQAQWHSGCSEIQYL